MPGESSAISAMISSNNISVPIHITDTKNGSIRETHNSYTAFASGSNTNSFLTTISNYAFSNRNLIRQQSLNYDLATSNLISSNELGGKSTTIAYGYNSSYPIAKVVNASSTSTGTTSTSSHYLGYTNLGSGSIQFTLPSAGSIQLSLGFGSYASGNITNASYYLTGASSSSGNLCYSMGGGNCGYGSSVTIPNVPAGAYTLTGYGNSTNSGVNPDISAYYIGPATTVSYTNEFFYEGFEAIGNVTGGAHTGNLSYNGSYNVPFTLPNNRSYVIQYWTLTNGVWAFHEQSYTGPTTLSGQIDDVKIFPTDAQMNTYSYNPLIGKTGETDPAGHTKTYEYDGLGRLDLTRDNEVNILQKNCYNFAGQSISCPVSSTNSFTNVSISQTFTKDDCSPGQTGSSVTYTVPAGQYISSISQSDANAQAQNDINSNGQSYADQYGTCTETNFDLNFNNNASNGFTVVFTNEDTYQQYTLIVTAYTSSTLPNLPPGTYDLYIEPNYSYYGNYYQIGCNYFTSSNSGSDADIWVYGIPLNSNCNTITAY